MNPDESAWLDEHLPLFLAACDDALAAGAPAPPACGEAPIDLRPRIERDLAWCQFVRQAWNHPPRSSLLPSTQLALPLPHPAPPSTPPATLGRFRLRRELGRGGFGVVFLAYDPVLGREVALKVPRAESLLTPELRARFEQEARAAAGLDHPNLVPVYDAGAEGPVCFIASAYCPGTTLAAWLKERTEPVPYPVAAQLIATLAEAVEHAHRRGVLHRDLKPSNVMLQQPTEELPADGLGFVPRVMDFGLAKLVAEGPAAGCETASGDVVGTPSYMAPEQATGRSRTVGPAADVYGLGAILYELLTGRPPFKADTALDTLLLVRTQEPLPPSRLRPKLARDLETICLKCLAKEPHKRYATAQALADDLRRFLAHEPIEARPTPAWERAVKWARRRPALAALAAVCVALVLAVVTVLAVAHVRLQRERDYAEAKRREAWIYLRKARDAADRLLTRVAQERLRDVPHMEPVQRQLLEDAAAFYEELAREAGDDPETRYEVGRAHHRLGKISAWLGKWDNAEPSYRRAVEVLTRLAGEFPGSRAYRQELAGTYTDLGVALRTNDRVAEADEALEQARTIQEQLTAEDPDDPACRLDLALTWSATALLRNQMGQPEEEGKALDRGLELLDDLVARHPDVADYRSKRAILRNNLAAFLDDSGRPGEAEEVYRQDQAVWEGLIARCPSEGSYRSRLSLTLSNLAGLLHRTGRGTEAEEPARRAVALTQQLAEDFPSSPHFQFALGYKKKLLSVILRDRGEHREARRLLEQAVACYRNALKLAPGMQEYRNALRETLAPLAEALLRTGEHAEAARVTAEWAALFPGGWQERVHAATYLARCVSAAESETTVTEEKRRAAAKSYAEQAVRLLREAVERGYRDREFLKHDSSLAVLRSRTDFQQLLHDLAAREEERR